VPQADNAQQLLQQQQQQMQQQQYLQYMQQMQQMQHNNMVCAVARIHSTSSITTDSHLCFALLTVKQFGNGMGLNMPHMPQMGMGMPQFGGFPSMGMGATGFGQPSTGADRAQALAEGMALLSGIRTQAPSVASSSSIIIHFSFFFFIFIFCFRHPHFLELLQAVFCDQVFSKAI
jgi:hypothetical protein